MGFCLVLEYLIGWIGCGVACRRALFAAKLRIPYALAARKLKASGGRTADAIDGA
jgi:hypothetical protein